VSEIEVTEEHLGWAGSVAQHLCHPADQGAATRLLADGFARYGEMVRQAARERALDEAAEVAEGNRTDDDSMWDRAAETITRMIRKLKQSGSVK